MSSTTSTCQVGKAVVHMFEYASCIEMYLFRTRLRASDSITEWFLFEHMYFNVETPNPMLDDIQALHAATSHVLRTA